MNATDSRRRWLALRHFLLALQFFTRIPVTGRLALWVGYSPAMLRASAAHFPGVGVLLGAAGATLAWAVLTALPAAPAAAWVAAWLTTALGIGLTGAFHEDGLADVADGLGGSLDRNRALEIMKDSRVGSFGVVALVLALLGKVALLALLGERGAALMASAFWAAQSVSRTWPLLTIARLTHVGDVAGSKSKPLADQIAPSALAVGTVWCVLGLALPGWLWGDALAAAGLRWVSVVAALSASAAAWGWTLRWFQRRLQGFTGDCLGATQQVCELAFYLGLALTLAP
ncbi:MAG: adenosylcobinamide-GDP ribazoletransferase [Rhodoferax sp.]